MHGDGLVTVPDRRQKACALPFSPQRHATAFPRPIDGYSAASETSRTNEGLAMPAEQAPSATRTGPPPHLVRSTEDAEMETWDDPVRGRVDFRTLFSREVTGTRALTTGIAVVPADGRLALHRHTAPEVYYVLRGGGQVLVDGVENEVGPGSAVFLPGGSWHGVRASGPEPLRLVYTLAADGMADVDYDFGE
jgi:mannose-6-phosphate isomerase-like protein (cupin superfamily)